MIDLLEKRVGATLDAATAAANGRTFATSVSPVLATPAAAPVVAVATWKLAAGAAAGAGSVVGAYVAGRWAGSW
ncbi:hypothetical protein [Arthrobacter flavus]|uniref:Uncharacterized protein n=1 Tax=Arthrobacter flavus TaxID=95172 RepID=A0ABW4Q3Z9_9MICC